MLNKKNLHWWKVGRDLDLVKRLVWGTAGPDAKSDTPVDAKKAEADKKAKETTEKEKAKEPRSAADKLQDLAVEKTEITYEPKGNINAGAFGKSLQEKISTLADFKNGTEGKTLTGQLLDALRDNLGGKGEKGYEKITKFLKEKKVTHFEIVKDSDGPKWAFYTGDGGKDPVKYDFQLDDDEQKKDEKDKKVDHVKYGVDKTDLTLETKNRGKKEKEENAAKEKVELEKKRLDSIDWGKLKVAPVALEKDGKVQSLDELLKVLSDGTKAGEAGKEVVQLTPQDLKAGLVDFMKANNIEGKDENEKFQNLVKILGEHGYIGIGIKEGKYLFVGEKGSGKRDFAPDLGRKVSDGKGVFKTPEAYVTPKSQEFVEGKEKVKAKEEADSKFQYEAEKIDGVVVEDPRYVDAMKAVKETFDTGKGTVFNLPRGDHGMYFTLEAWSGSTKEKPVHILKYNEDKNQLVFPDAKLGLPADYQGVMKYINEGKLTQEVDWNTIRDKKMLESYDIDGGREQTGVNFKIDGDVEVVKGKDHTVHFEVDWPGIGADPDVYVQVLPGGKLAVEFVSSGIGLAGEKNIKFEANGYKDLIRKINALRTWNDLPDDKKAEKRSSEEFRRMMDKGTAEVQMYADGKNLGKVLNVRSNNLTIEAAPRQGYFMTFDWLSKVKPGAEFQMSEIGGGRYEARITPGLILGAVSSLNEGLSLLAKQRQYLDTAGGEEQMKKDFMSKLDTFAAKAFDFKTKSGEKAELGEGVLVKGISGNVVYLAMGKDYAPQAFPMDDQGFIKAKEAGYWKFASETAKTAPVDPDKLPKPESVDLSVKRDLLPAKPKKAVEPPQHEEAYREKVDMVKALTETFKGINNAKVRMALVNVLMPTMNGVKVPDKKSSDYAAQKNIYDEKILSLVNEYFIKQDKMGYKKNPYITMEEAITGINQDYKKVDESLLENCKVIFEEKKVPDELKDKPRSLAIISGLAFALKLSDANSGELLNARSEYVKQMAILAKDLLSSNPDLKKLSGEKLDVRLSEEFKKRVLKPEEFAKKYEEKIAKQKAIDEAKVAKEKFDKEKVDGAINGPSLAEVESKAKETGMSSLVAKVVEQVKTESTLFKGEIFLSNVADNTKDSTGRIALNAVIGEAPNLRPITLVVRPSKGGGMEYAMAKGWNNLTVLDDNFFPERRIKAAPGRYSSPIKEAMGKMR